MSSLIRRRGFLLVLSSPSGAGKTTITRQLVASDPGLALSVSVTTRPPRDGEVEGRDYYFINPCGFDEMIAQGELLEHATVFGNCYGTPRGPIEKALAAGRDIVGDVDWQGTQQLAKSVPRDLVSAAAQIPRRDRAERFWRAGGCLASRRRRRCRDLRRGPFR